ncbi:MAG: domain containing protein [Ferruginibacter sp.]|nr:domain containing protein [Ferruginibacter sp.]
MDNEQMFMMLPGMQPEELALIRDLTRNMNDSQQRQFYSLYQSRRKDQQTLMILAILGFFGFAGIHRFVVGDIGMGILYLFTGGLCLIGTIVDMVNIKQIAADFNQRQAMETIRLMKVGSLVG